MARPEGHKDAAYLATVIADEQVTTLHFVPTMLQVFLEEPSIRALTSIRRVVCSGEVLGPALRNRFFEKLPEARLWNLYGPTEATVDVSVHRCGREGPDWTVPIGRPIANTRLHVLDERMRSVPIGTPGELYIGGVQVARGYIGRDDLTAERFVRAPEVDVGRIYRTGDLVRWNVDGELEFIGRLDDQVKLRGFRIELGEIESALEGIEGVRQAAVMAREVGAGGPSLVAYVVGDEPDPGAAYGPALGRKLPDYMLPAYWVALDAMPVTSSGKVARRNLPMPERRAVDAEYVAPEGSTENALAEIWQQVLEIDRVGRHESFFDLGGHSILATRVVARVRDVFGIELPLRSVFAVPTLARLADEIDVVRSARQLASTGDRPDDEEMVF
jgi:acyl-coenzyme A synthetase/AMP-(fatty) acid ligase/acyl carrier protein